MKEKLYSYREAAAMLGLANASCIQKRLTILERRGEPLSVEAGEICEEKVQYWGVRRILTERGLQRLLAFVPGKAGRPKAYTE